MYKIEKYYLIDWGTPATQYRTDGLSSDVIYMTEEQANKKNKELVQGMTTLRYVKANIREVYPNNYNNGIDENKDLYLDTEE
jgi:hypothetical protein